MLGGGPVGVEIAQIVRRLGGDVSLVEGAEHLLGHEPGPLGDALAEVLRRDGIEVVLGEHAAAARRDGEDFVLVLESGREVRGDRLLVATGRTPRVEGIGLETVGITADRHGIPVDAQMRAGERLWALGDVTGIWPLTHVGKYQGEVVAANILGEPREADYRAVPRISYTDPQAAAVGATEARFSATVPVSELAKTETYTRAYAQSNGFLTLLSDGEVLTGAYALGPEAGEWLQQATLAIRARVPLDVLRDTIQPFPTFSEIYVGALKALRDVDQVVRRTDERRAARADRGRDRRQCRDRSGDRPTRTCRGGRGRPDSTRSGAAGTCGCGAGRKEQYGLRRHRLRSSRPVLRGPPAPIDHLMLTAGGPYYAPLADIDFDQARRDVDGHLWLTLRVAQHAQTKVRPGGTLLFVSGTGGRRPGVGLSVVRRSPRACRHSQGISRSSWRRSASTSSLPASSTPRCRRRSSATSSNGVASSCARRCRSGGSWGRRMSPRWPCTS